MLRSKYNLVKRRSQVAFQLVVMIAMTAAALLLGIVPLFGAFVAGIVVVTASGERAGRRVRRSGTSPSRLFIPVYFAIVGLQLDLVDNFDIAVLRRVPGVRVPCQGAAASTRVHGWEASPAGAP